MLSISINRPTHGAEGQAFSRKLIWLRLLVLVGLGAMVLAIFCILPGCGSDSNPGGAVKGKDEKTAKSSVKVIPRREILLYKESKVKEYPTGSGSPRIEVLPGVTQGELDARGAVDRKKFDSPRIKVLPGVTQGELDARQAAERNPDPRLMLQTFPGVTQK